MRGGRTWTLDKHHPQQDESAARSSGGSLLERELERDRDRDWEGDRVAEPRVLETMVCRELVLGTFRISGELLDRGFGIEWEGGLA